MINLVFVLVRKAVNTWHQTHSNAHFILNTPSETQSNLDPNSDPFRH
jgi:hypothetical protein